MSASRVFVGLVGIALFLAGCGMVPAPIDTAPPRPESTAPAAFPTPPPELSGTPSPPSALAPPGGITRTVHASPTRVAGDSRGPLALMIETEHEALTGEADMNLLPSIQPAAVSVEYTGEWRALAPGTGGFLWQFGGSFGPEDFAADFQQELLVREGDLVLWMPVGESVVSDLGEAFEPGQLATVYARLLGSLRTDVEQRVIFIITGVGE